LYLVAEGEDLSDEALVQRIQQCFNVDDIKKCVSRLQGLNTPWGASTAAQLERVPPTALENWFRITRLAGKESLESVYRMEIAANSSLRNPPATRK
jgi:hypothetical protein